MMECLKKLRARSATVRLLLLLGVLLAATFTASPVRADVSIEVHDLTFDEVGKNEFVAGQAVLMREPVWWESDAPWEITVECLDNNLGVSDDGSYVKPLRDLQFKLSEDSQWIKIRRRPEQIVQSNQTGEGQLTVDWRVLLNWIADRPGSYQADLLFRITQY